PAWSSCRHCPFRLPAAQTHPRLERAPGIEDQSVTTGTLSFMRRELLPTYAVITYMANDDNKPPSRAFRGLFLVFVLTFINFAGIGLTLMMIGGLEPWSAWQFLGLFGVIE